MSYTLIKSKITIKCINVIENMSKQKKSIIKISFPPALSNKTTVAVVDVLKIRRLRISKKLDRLKKSIFSFTYKTYWLFANS